MSSPHPEDFCDDCGGPNVVWHAPNETWNEVMDPRREAIICPVCFVKRSEVKGIGRVWRLEVWR